MAEQPERPAQQAPESAAEDPDRSLTLDELQGILHRFETDSWDALSDEAGYTRHTALHLMKLAGKLGAVCERREHALEPDLQQLHEEVIPDLLYFALGLAHKQGVDLQQAFLTRLDMNAARVGKWVADRDQSIPPA